MADPATATSEPRTTDPIPTTEQSAGMKAALTGNLKDRAEATRKFKETADGHAAQVQKVVDLVAKKNERVSKAADRLAEGDAAANAIAQALEEGSRRLAAFEAYLADQKTFLASIVDGDDDHDDEEAHAALDVLPSSPKSATTNEGGDASKPT